MPSAEQADNRRRGRAEDRIPNRSGQNGPADAHRKNKALHNLGLQDRGSHHLLAHESSSQHLGREGTAAPTLPVYGNH